MGGLFISLMGTSVVILVIDEFRVAVLECEGQSPVSADTDAPVIGQFSLEGMQSPAGDGTDKLTIVAPNRGLFGANDDSNRIHGGRCRRGMERYAPE